MAILFALREVRWLFKSTLQLGQPVYSQREDHRTDTTSNEFEEAPECVSINWAKSAARSRASTPRSAIATWNLQEKKGEPGEEAVWAGLRCANSLRRIDTNGTLPLCVRPN